MPTGGGAYSKAEMEEIIKRRLDEQRRRIEIDSLKTDLRKLSDRMERYNEEHTAAHRRIEVRLDEQQAVRRFAQTLWGRASIVVAMITGVVLMLHDIGLIH